MKRQWKQTVTVLLTACLLFLYGCGGNPAPKTDDGSPDASSQEVASQPETADPALVRLAGHWYIDGDRNAAHLEIREDGRFTAYYSSGAAEQEGYVIHERNEPMAQTDYSYRFYTDDGTLYLQFIDLESDPFDAFEVGEDVSLCYRRVAD